jgi:hypothetical protein
MPKMTASTYEPEFEELTEETRKQVQLDQSERLTMGGHIRRLLKMRRNRVAEAWGQKSKSPGEPVESAEDDMQLLARDITINETHPVPQQTQAPAKSNRLPWLAALALSGAIPVTTGVLMLPKIIAACHPAPAVTPSDPLPEYAPILMPGRPKAME